MALFSRDFQSHSESTPVDPGLPDEERAWSFSAAMRGEMLEIWRRNGDQPSCAVAPAIPLFDARRTIPYGSSRAIPIPAWKYLRSGPSSAATGTGNNAAIGAGSRRGTKVSLAVLLSHPGRLH